MRAKEILETESAIQFIKKTFADKLSKKLQLTPVSSPIAVLDGTGINDDLNGVERPVAFAVKAMNDKRAVVVHSLAKWKRMRLRDLEMKPGQGILTDMRALRPDEDFSPLHSIYVDQWDWEKAILEKDRTLSFLKSTVRSIYQVILATENAVAKKFPSIKPTLPPSITFLHTEDLLKAYPNLSPKERENKAAEKYGAIFIIGVGHELSDGQSHDGRAPDYDDWSSVNEEGYHGLNGDIALWHPTLKCAFEVSSMGIRVNKSALQKQLTLRKEEKRSSLLFHKMLLEGKLPQSIGGGIGQSRICMFMLKRQHIGEVQVGIWEDGQVELASFDIL